MYMQMRLLSLILGFVSWLPLASLADQNLQARCEKSLKDAKSLSNVEVVWLDTLWINDPEVLKALNVKEFSRTMQYSYIASGLKYHAICKLISGTSTNLMKQCESAFDGNSFCTYSVENRRMTTSHTNALFD